MKKIFKLFALISLLFIYSCNDNTAFDTTDQLTGTASEGGAIVSINTNSDGKLLGAPSSSDLTTATVAFSDNFLQLGVMLMSGGQNVSSYEIMKSLNGGTEVSAVTSSTLPISLDYTTLNEYLDGLGKSPADLRIGDVITFRTKITKTDGSVYFAGPNEGSFNVTINCSADLSGTYLVTNDACAPSFTTTITANPDGTWHIADGDGGFLDRCTSNSTLVNWANITVVCGEVLPTGDLNFGSANSGYDIGEISGGAWDGGTGILTMSHTQTLTTNWPATWTSTYTRQ
ncbi:hypothetical protein [Lutibacter sp.]|uniref:hypothetical protein n=1 Tax=Lutibacter sp. TaxID=1925666 RepID=UPI0025BD52AC|nr:hypothetical protein [Lutibacter sp.]MCF6180790.1 hypothetical protein [Lutibacter sp.]